MDLAILAEINEERAARRAAILVTDIRPAPSALCRRRTSPPTRWLRCSRTGCGRGRAGWWRRRMARCS